VQSGPRRVTMMFEGEIDVDTTVIHPVPMPRAFTLPRSATRTIRIGLAFDPPVRRTRREYTAATMAIDVYRGVDLAELQERLAVQDPADPQPLYSGRRRINKEFRPTSTSLRESTLQIRDWSPQLLKVDDGDTYYLSVTHSTRTWFRGRQDYTSQKYALTISLMDESLVELDLSIALTQNISVPARVRNRIQL
jgi:hypothetical protein